MTQQSPKIPRQRQNNLNRNTFHSRVNRMFLGIFRYLFIPMAIVGILGGSPIGNDLIRGFIVIWLFYILFSQQKLKQRYYPNPNPNPRDVQNWGFVLMASYAGILSVFCAYWMGDYMKVSDPVYYFIILYLYVCIWTGWFLSKEPEYANFNKNYFKAFFFHIGGMGFAIGLIILEGKNIISESIEVLIALIGGGAYYWWGGGMLDRIRAEGTASQQAPLDTPEGGSEIEDEASDDMGDGFDGMDIGE